MDIFRMIPANSPSNFAVAEKGDFNSASGSGTEGDFSRSLEETRQSMEALSGSSETRLASSDGAGPGDLAEGPAGSVGEAPSREELLSGLRSGVDGEEEAPRGQDRESELEPSALSRGREFLRSLNPASEGGEGRRLARELRQLKTSALAMKSGRKSPVEAEVAAEGTEARPGSIQAGNAPFHCDDPDAQRTGSFVTVPGDMGQAVDPAILPSPSLRGETPESPGFSGTCEARSYPAATSYVPETGASELAAKARPAPVPGDTGQETASPGANSLPEEAMPGGASVPQRGLFGEAGESGGDPGTGEDLAAPVRPGQTPVKDSSPPLSALPAGKAVGTGEGKVSGDPVQAGAGQSRGRSEEPSSVRPEPVLQGQGQAQDGQEAFLAPGRDEALPLLHDRDALDGGESPEAAGVFGRGSNPPAGEVKNSTSGTVDPGSSAGSSGMGANGAGERGDPALSSPSFGLRDKAADSLFPASDESFRAETEHAAPLASGSATFTEQTAVELRSGEVLLQSRGAEALARGLAETVHVIRRREGHRGTVEVSPPDLGKVRITVDSSGDSVQVHLRVDSAQVRDMLQQTSDVLREALERQGLNLTEMSVDVGQQGMGEGPSDGRASRGGTGQDHVPALSEAAGVEEEEVVTRLDLERGILNWVA